MSMTISVGQARIVDPVLSTVARGFMEQELVANAIFPMVPVDLRGGNIVVFGREEFRQYQLKRAPGAATVRIPFGYSGQPYALTQDALETSVPREHMQDASRMPGVDLGTVAVRKATRIIALALEVEQAALARATSSYPATNRVALASGSRWTDATVNPSATIETGREAIRASIGVYPNTVLLSAKAFSACRTNPLILDRFKYTSRDSITTEMLASLWDIPRVVVGRGVTTDQADAVTDIWGGDVIMAYTAIGPISNAEPSFGFTYTMRGHPIVEQPYWDNSHKSWQYPVTYERAPVVANTGAACAGYLIQTAA